MKRLPRTIRLDESDARIFEPAAEAGEWAVSGAFVFADCEPETLERKARQAFFRGFLGTGSFGWSTLVVVSEVTEAAYESVIDILADHFVEVYGAPSLAAARPVAQDEVDFAAGLCNHKANTLLRVEREMTPRGVVERFAVVEPAKSGQHAKVWEIVEDEETDDHEEGPR